MKAPPSSRKVLVAAAAGMARLAAGLGNQGHGVVQATTRGDALEQLLLRDGFDIVVTGMHFPDGRGLDVARTAAVTLPTPFIVAVADDASVEEAFELGKCGVHLLLREAPTAEALLHHLEQSAARALLPLYAHLAPYVGRIALLDMEQDVRHALVMQALERTGGSRSAAARLLGTSRQMIQKVVNAGDL